MTSIDRDHIEVETNAQPLVETDLDLRVRRLLRKTLADSQHIRAQMALLAEKETAGRAAIEAEFLERTQTIERRCRSAIAQADRELQSARVRSATELEQQHAALESECHTSVDKVTADLKRLQTRAAKEKQEATWLARTVFDAKRDQLRKHLLGMRKQLRAKLRVAANLRQAADAWLAVVGQAPPPLQPDANRATDDDPRRQMHQSLGEAEQYLAQLQQLRLPGMVHGARVLWVCIAIGLVVFPATGWLLAWHLLSWLIVGSAVTIALGALVSIRLKRIARQQVQCLAAQLYESLQEAEECGAECLRIAVSVYQQERLRAKETLAAETERAAANHSEAIKRIEFRRETELPAITSRCAEQLNLLAASYEHERESLSSEHQRVIRDAQAVRERDLAAAESYHNESICHHESDCNELRSKIEQRRSESLSFLRAELATIESELNKRAVAARLDYGVPRAICFGRASLDVQSLHSACESEVSIVPVPAILSFPQGLPVTVLVEPEGGTHASEWLRTVLMQLLTSLPAGSLRLTIIDPSGLGKDLSSFMHLADYDASLVGGRIWTDPVEIERRLAELSEHVESVTQKCLRDEFATIEAYNEQANEMAEPYRLLVVHDYPAGFNDGALRRFQNIIQAGPRCGVHAIVTTAADKRKRNQAPLPQSTNTFRVSRSGVKWLDADFAALPLTVDPLPSPAQCKQQLHEVGRAAAGARRVEVPFEVIAPPPEQYWTENSGEGISIPLGRSGATRLQHLSLGRGTAQHVLIAGKTGSGKSTLLHALITNAALRYSPAELEMYLIDFKKGVEFKTYATHVLPHAKVIAIESEREFGLSVMQRLDEEMLRRGELFRSAGVQDIAAYRRQGMPLARVLFVVDEFQEFFVEDDRIAREAALLLDRLVRQGRAFGIHVHLGSQTLGGAYTLARTTLGQMAVRIALQCSESDAHLILSEDNTAARMLSRPGEAIYNDANGFAEGNHSFQVVWLSDDRREFYLTQLQDLASTQGQHAAPPVVFEGMRPASIEHCSEVTLHCDGAGQGKRRPNIWLGEPIAIREATSVVLQPKPSAHLLFLGQNAEANSGMLVAALVSLLGSVQHGAKPSKPTVYLLDGSTGEAGHKTSLSRLAQHFEGELQVRRVDEAETIVQRLYGDLQERQHNPQAAEEQVFLIVYGLTSFRALRRADDDFGFSRSSDSELSVSAKLEALLQEGPSLGIHLLVWCDSLPALQRTLGRQALREFGMRVLLQMSANDSNLLIDQPSASALGPFRALLHTEDEGRLEKFRPFALPTPNWLEAFCQQKTGTPAAT